MDFTVDGRPFAMAAGETIHTENSHKYGPRDARMLLRAGGWTPIARMDRPRGAVRGISRRGAGRAGRAVTIAARAQTS